MRNRRSTLAVLGLLALMLYNLGCDSADNPLAPSGTVLTISANPTRIGLNGQSTISIAGFKPDGNPLTDGTIVNLSTDRGVLGQSVITTTGGRGSTTLTGDGVSGAAIVTASLPAGGEGSAMATVTVQVGEAADSKPTLTISASPSILDLNESAQVTAEVRNSDGSLFGAGGTVSLQTSLGWFVSGSSCGTSGNSSINVQTDSSSEARATFCAGDQPGTATMTGTIGSSDPAEASVTVENQKPTLLISANPSVIPVAPDPASGTPVLSEITIIARDSNDVSVGAGRRIRLTSDLGTTVSNRTTRSPISEIETDSNGEAVLFFQPGQRAGQGSVTAVLDSSDPFTTEITIQDAPGSILLSANPTSIQRLDEGTTVTLRATVRGAQGDTLGGVVVDFDPERGTLDQTQATSNAQGVAIVTLTVTSQDVQSIPQDGTFSVTARATGEGVTVTDDVEISVLGSP